MQKAGTVMSRLWFVALVCALAEPASAQVSDLIRQNVQNATKSYRQLATEPARETPQLWIHVRSENQKGLVADNLGVFRSIKVGGQAVDVRPIQLVASGPQESQLRYFKPQDREQAELLLTALRKAALPRLQLRDMSAQYANIDWIARGHYELWLGRDVSAITGAR